MNGSRSVFVLCMRRLTGSVADRHSQYDRDLLYLFLLDSQDTLGLQLL